MRANRAVRGVPLVMALGLTGWLIAAKPPAASKPPQAAPSAPAWCRSMVSSASGAVMRFDVMRPDGSDRRRVAGATASAATSDVGFLDRFEVLTEGDGATQNLLLYDIQARKLTAVADRVGMVLARSGMLWWSTGEQEVTQWHALDLRTLLT